MLCRTSATLIVNKIKIILEFLSFILFIYMHPTQGKTLNLLTYNTVEFNVNKYKFFLNFV